MTNLVTSVVTLLITNTVELKTNVVESYYPPVSTNDSEYFIIRSSNNNEDKWVTTSVIKKETVSCDWNGKYTVLTLREESLTNKTVHYRIKPNWEIVKE